MQTTDEFMEAQQQLGQAGASPSFKPWWHTNNGTPQQQTRGHSAATTTDLHGMAPVGTSVEMLTADRIQHSAVTPSRQVLTPGEQHRRQAAFLARLQNETTAPSGEEEVNPVLVSGGNKRSAVAAADYFTPDRHTHASRVSSSLTPPPAAATTDPAVDVAEGTGGSSSRKERALYHLDDIQVAVYNTRPSEAHYHQQHASINSEHALLTFTDQKCVLYCYDRGVVLETVRPCDVMAVEREGEIVIVTSSISNDQPYSPSTAGARGAIQTPCTWSALRVLCHSEDDAEEAALGFQALKVKYLGTPGKLPQHTELEKAMVLQHKARSHLSLLGIRPEGVCEDLAWVKQQFEENDELEAWKMRRLLKYQGAKEYTDSKRAQQRDREKAVERAVMADGGSSDEDDTEESASPPKQRSLTPKNRFQQQSASPAAPSMASHLQQTPPPQQSPYNAAQTPPQQQQYYMHQTPPPPSSPFSPQHHQHGVSPYANQFLHQQAAHAAPSPAHHHASPYMVEGLSAAMKPIPSVDYQQYYSQREESPPSPTTNLVASPEMVPPRQEVTIRCRWCRKHCPPEHEQKCAKRVIECKYCKAAGAEFPPLMPADEMKTHYAVCKNRKKIQADSRSSSSGSRASSSKRRVLSPTGQRKSRSFAETEKAPLPDASGLSPAYSRAVGVLSKLQNHRAKQDTDSSAPTSPTTPTRRASTRKVSPRSGAKPEVARETEFTDSLNSLDSSIQMMKDIATPKRSAGPPQPEAVESRSPATPIARRDSDAAFADAMSERKSSSMLKKESQPTSPKVAMNPPQQQAAANDGAMSSGSLTPNTRSILKRQSSYTGSGDRFGPTYHSGVSSSSNPTSSAEYTANKKQQPGGNTAFSPANQGGERSGVTPPASESGSAAPVRRCVWCNKAAPETHDAKCKKRKVRCKTCGAVILQGERSEHNKVCLGKKAGDPSSSSN